MTTEAETIAALATQADETLRTSVLDLPVEVPALVAVDVHDDRSVKLSDLERLLPEPRRPRGTVTVLGEASFVHAVNRWGWHERTAVYVDTGTLTMVAILNDAHPANETATEVAAGEYGVPAGWRDHRVNYVAPLSEAVKPWADLSGEFAGQQDFAEFIEANMGAVADPSGRDLYEIVTTLEGTVGASWKHHHRDTDGSRVFHYAEDTTASAGQAGELAIPPTFTLAVPGFEGGDPRAIEAKLRYRIGAGGIALGFVLTGFDEIVRDEFQAVIERVHDGLDDEACGEVLLAKAPAEQAPTPSRVDSETF